MSKDIIAISTEQIDEQVAKLEAEYAHIQEDGQKQLDAINTEVAKQQQRGVQIQGETVGQMNQLRGQINLLKELAEKKGLASPNGSAETHGASAEGGVGD